MPSGKHFHLPSVALGAVLTCGLFLFIERAEILHAAEKQWMPATFEEAALPIEQQLRGFDTTMWEVGYRFVELHAAGEAENWDYALYQLEKIGHVIHLGTQRRPKRATSAQPFLGEVLPAVDLLVKERNRDAFDKAYERLRSGCMQCHVAEQVPFFTVGVPAHHLSPITSDTQSAVDELK